MIDLSRYILTFKTRLRENEKNFQSVPVSEMPGMIKSYSAYPVETGIVAVYWKTAVTGPDGIYHQLVFDIESSDKHDDIGENIETALHAYWYFTEKGLTDGLEIILSGKGFRFVWPYLVPPALVRALRVFIRKSGFTDPSSMTNFHRFFAYRGNKIQGKKPADIHTHLLDSHHWLSDLSEQEYRQLTAGKPNYTDYCLWIEKILPRRMIPEPWVKVLEEIKADAYLEKAFIRFPKQKRRSHFRIDTAKAELDKRGIRYRELQKADLVFLKLSECLFCSRKDTNAFVTASGRAKCHSVNCIAGAKDEYGSITGIHPLEWVEGYEPEPAEYPEEPVINDSRTLAEIRKDIAEEMQTCIENEQDVFVSVEPGIGKTTTASRILSEHAKDRTIIFCLPTKEKVKEEYERVQQSVQEIEQAYIENGIIPVSYSIIVGRHNGTKKNDHMDANCIQFEKCNEIGKLGYMPGLIVCPQCFEYKTCEYYRQYEALKRPGIIFTTHAQLPNLKARPKSIVVFDEDPFSSLIRKIEVDLGQIISFSANYSDFAPDRYSVRNSIRKIQDFLENALALVKADKTRKYAVFYSVKPKHDVNAVSIWEAAKISDIERHDLETWLSFFTALKEEKNATWQKRLYYGKWPGGVKMWNTGEFDIKTLRWFLCLCGIEPGSALIEIHPGKTPFRFTAQFRDIPEIKNRLWILDGTGWKEVYDRIFHRDFHEIQGKVSLHSCKFFHVRQ